MHGANERAGGRADGRTSGRANGAERARTVRRTGAERAQTVGRMGGRADWAVGGGRDVVEQRGWSRAEKARSGRLGGRTDWVDSRTGGRGGGPGFKRPHSTRPISLLDAQSACLVRARVCGVLGSVEGSRRIPRQTPVLYTRTHLPRLSASVLDAEKGILLL